MKFKNIAVIASMLSLAAVANAQINISSQFVNLDFDSGIVTTGNGAFAGFDAPAAPEIIGWQNYGTVTDAGVEAAGAWWLSGYANQNAAFINNGGGAYNLSSYVIQAGDVFTTSFISWHWWNQGQMTVSLFYDNPGNIIGSYVINTTAWSPTTYDNAAAPIAATAGSVGGTLGILFQSTGAGIATLDEVVVNVTPVPEPTTIAMIMFGGVGMLALRRRFVK
jgi:hypothetical protein